MGFNSGFKGLMFYRTLVRSKFERFSVVWNSIVSTIAKTSETHSAEFPSSRSQSFLFRMAMLLMNIPLNYKILKLCMTGDSILMHYS